MKKWRFDSETKTFRNETNEFVITYEQYENLRGKHNKPSDELLDALEVILSR